MDLVEVQDRYKNSVSLRRSMLCVANVTSMFRYKKVGIVEDAQGSIYFKTVTPNRMTIVSSNVTPYVLKASEVMTGKRYEQGFLLVVDEVYTRLDLVAQKMYGNATLFWALAMYNGIMDPMDVPLGTVLEVPSKASLFGDKGVL